MMPSQCADYFLRLPSCCFKFMWKCQSSKVASYCTFKTLMAPGNIIRANAERTEILCNTHLWRLRKEKGPWYSQCHKLYVAYLMSPQCTQALLLPQLLRPLLIYPRNWFLLDLAHTMSHWTVSAVHMSGLPEGRSHGFPCASWGSVLNLAYKR